MPNYSGLWTRQAQLQATSVPNWPAPPGAPTGISASVASGTSVTVSFTAPTNTGIPAGITGYRVTSSPGGITATGSASPITVTGLTTGQAYTFTVAAQNASGYGPESAASNSVTPDNYYIENVFSTYLYTGNGSTQTITNGIDLSGNGGLVWIKSRTQGSTNYIGNNVLYGSAIGYERMYSNSTAAAGVGNVISVSSTGFTTEGLAATGYNGDSFVSWTFRKQPKFFDIVTYTGTGSARTIAHNLGSAPGCMIVKQTSGSTQQWNVYHRSLGYTQYMYLSGTNSAATYAGVWQAEPTSTVFSVGDDAGTNASGATYVAYLFAHNAGGFGATGNDNVISCGSYTGNGSLSGPTVTLGYEPQWLLVKQSNASGQYWNMIDSMRDMSLSSNRLLFSDLNVAELVANTSGGYNGVTPLSTGFSIRTNDPSFNANGGTYIYIAIRRGPMKTPTLGTTVFKPETASTDDSYTNAGFPVDWMLEARRNGDAANTVSASRLTAGNLLVTSSTAAQSNSLSSTTFTSNTGVKPGIFSTPAGGLIFWQFQRAPGFFDVVCYTGTGVATTVNHNLGVVPELMIVKRRDSSGFDGFIYSSTTGNSQSLSLFAGGGGNSQAFASSVWNNTTPTSSVFSVQTNGGVNASGGTYVAYLFASCAGVSKVGSYTGTGTTQQINCGFTGGARFVLIKRTDSTGDWYVWDSARGIVAGNDPYLLLNSTAAEVTNTDYVDTYAAGFEISSTAPAAINANGGTFIYLAIA